MKPALIVIDMQNGFLRPQSPLFIKEALDTVPACTRVIENCRSRDIPVFFVIRSYRANGSDVEHSRFNGWLSGGKPLSPGCEEIISGDMPAEFGPREGDYVVMKPRFSAFFHTELDLILRRLGVDTVILTGTTTPNCIRTSLYDAISLEYNAVVISDCTSSVSADIQRANLRDMENIGGQILSAADFIAGAELWDNTAKVRESVAGGCIYAG